MECGTRLTFSPHETCGHVIQHEGGKAAMIPGCDLCGLILHMQWTKSNALAPRQGSQIGWHRQGLQIDIQQLELEQ